MNELNRRMHGFCYYTSILIVTASIGLHAMDLSVPMFYEDFNELTGIISAILMSFELALLWGIETTKRKLLPKACQKQGILATRYLRNYHVPVGVLSCSLLITALLPI